MEAIIIIIWNNWSYTYKEKKMTNNMILYYYIVYFCSPSHWLRTVTWRVIVTSYWPARGDFIKYHYRENSCFRFTIKYRKRAKFISVTSLTSIRKQQQGRWRWAMKALNFEPIYELRWILTLKLSSFDKLNDYYYVQDNSATDFMLKLSLAIFFKEKSMQAIFEMVPL